MLPLLALPEMQRFKVFLKARKLSSLPVLRSVNCFYGAEKSERVEANLAEIAKFAAGRTILVCDAETARWYGRIKRQLQLKGRPIPQNDIWIAAVARQHNLTLVTRDEHFEQIEALPLKTW
jgi:tRNA(fMet)-specific endonuclease VapC